MGLSMVHLGRVRGGQVPECVGAGTRWSRQQLLPCLGGRSRWAILTEHLRSSFIFCTQPTKAGVGHGLAFTCTESRVTLPSSCAATP
jgi:hypothetical protein